MSRVTAILFGALLAAPALLSAQGPRISYFYHPATELPWASASISFDGGSRQKFQFLPVIGPDQAPMGTGKYGRDVHVRASIFFAGSGGVEDDGKDPYAGADVNGKVAMLALDTPEKANAVYEDWVALAERIADAVNRRAAGLLLFSFHDQYPFIHFQPPLLQDVPEIPMITVTMETVQGILASAGLDAESVLRDWRETGTAESKELISKAELYIHGRFDCTDSDYFTFCFFQKNLAGTDELVRLNDRSIDFLLKLFEKEGLRWEKSFITYFPDFDSKLFYTHHWGRGLSSAEGTFMVYHADKVDYGLAVHENAHTLISTSWSDSSSFMVEGIAKYAEAMATDPEVNHRQTAGLLRQGRLYPLTEMLTFEIGSHAGTDVAYPAAGSFVQYLIDTYSLGHFKNVYQLEAASEEQEWGSIWQKAFGKSIRELETDWHAWLLEHYRRGSEKKNVEPRPTPSDSTQMRPPWGALVSQTHIGNRRGDQRLSAASGAGPCYPLLVDQ